MFIEKTPEVISLEQSLINFLCSKKDIERNVNGGMRRIKGLTLGIDIQEKNSYFLVSIGMCQAWFNLETGLRERGNCYGLDHHIREWYKIPAVRTDIKNILSPKSKH